MPYLTRNSRDFSFFSSGRNPTCLQFRGASKNFLKGSFSRFPLFLDYNRHLAILMARRPFVTGFPGFRGPLPASLLRNGLSPALPIPAVLFSAQGNLLLGASKNFLKGSFSRFPIPKPRLRFFAGIANGLLFFFFYIVSRFFHRHSTIQSL